MPNTWPRKCTRCGEMVDYDGTNKITNGFGPCKKKVGNHEVEFVTYYHPGARTVQDIRDRRLFSPDVVLIPGYDYIDPLSGKMTLTRRLHAKFSDGKFETTDPEQQWYLDQKGDILSGEEGLKMWREIYLTPEVNLAIKAAELKVKEGQLADVERKIQESNTLLEQLKAKQGHQARA